MKNLEFSNLYTIQAGTNSQSTTCINSSTYHIAFFSNLCLIGGILSFLKSWETPEDQQESLGASGIMLAIGAYSRVLANYAYAELAEIKKSNSFEHTESAATI